MAFTGARCTFKENMREAAGGWVQQQLHCTATLDRFYCKEGGWVLSERERERENEKERKKERGEGEGEEVSAQLGGVSCSVCDFS